MRRRFLLTMTTALSAVGVIVLATTGGPETTRVAEGQRTDCSAAGTATLNGVANAVPFGDATIMAVPELRVGDKPAQVTAAVTAAGGTSVRVTDVKGADRLDVTTDGTTWLSVADGTDIAYPAVSPDGERIAYSVDGALLTATRAANWAPEAIALPNDGTRAQYVRFTDDGRLLMAVAVAVPGVAEDFGALSDVWLHELASGNWTRLTTTEPDVDRWSIAKTPVFDANGDLLYVRHTGRGSGTDADLRTTLFRNDKAVRDLPDRWGIVAVDGTATLWNAPDERSQWQLVRTEAGGTMSTLGCGRASWAPSLNHDPDYTP